VLRCARDRTRFERVPCERGTHCEGAGACLANAAPWPTRWSSIQLDPPAAQSMEPWTRWGGACGNAALDARLGETALVFTSDRTLHGRNMRWPQRGAWAVQARVRWHREATVRIYVGAYVSPGEAVAGTMQQFAALRDALSIQAIGRQQQAVAAAVAVEQWHVIRFEAHAESARSRWLLDGQQIHEAPLQPMDAFGPWLIIAGIGSCETNVLAISDVSLEEGAQ
jgi:hypothetical protein